MVPECPDGALREGEWVQIVLVIEGPGRRRHDELIFTCAGVSRSIMVRS